MWLKGDELFRVELGGNSLRGNGGEYTAYLTALTDAPFTVRPI